MKNNKEFLTDIEEDNKYRQGRTRKQYESSSKGACISWGMLGLISICYVIYYLIKLF